MNENSRPVFEDRPPSRARIRAGFRKDAAAPAVPLDAQRRAWEEAASQAPLPPGIRSRPISLPPASGLLLERTDSVPDGIVIYVHGGGFTSGSSITHRALGGWIALAAKCNVLLVDYRLAPESPFPAARDDTVTAFRWARDQGYAPGQITIAGDSAGGHIVVTAVLELIRNEGCRPAAIALISPWLDLTLAGETLRTLDAIDPLVTTKALQDCAGMYLGGRPAADPSTSPLEADLTGFPPVLVHVGSDEMLLSDAKTFVERAKAAGVDVQCAVWPEMWHVFHAWAPELPEAESAIAELGAFIDSRTNRA